jgi:tRNA A-37 threonylcarbamoyl transferase component Bud32
MNDTTDQREIRDCLLRLSKNEERFLHLEPKIAIFYKFILKKKHFNFEENIPVLGLFFRQHSNTTVEIIILFKGIGSLNVGSSEMKDIQNIELITEKIKSEPNLLFMCIYEHLIKLQNKHIENKDYENIRDLEEIIENFRKCLRRIEKDRTLLDLNLVLIRGKREEYQNDARGKENQKRLELHKKHRILDIRSFGFLNEDKHPDTKKSENTLKDDILAAPDTKDFHSINVRNERSKSSQNNFVSDLINEDFGIPFDKLPHFFSHFEVRKIATSEKDQVALVLDLIQNSLHYMAVVLLCESLPFYYTGIANKKIAQLEDAATDTDDIDWNKWPMKYINNILVNDSLGKDTGYIRQVSKKHQTNSQISNDVHELLSSNKKNNKKWADLNTIIINGRNNYSHQGMSNFDAHTYLNEVKKVFPLIRSLMNILVDYQMGQFKKDTNTKEDGFVFYYWFSSLGKSIYTPPVLLKFKSTEEEIIPEDETVLLKNDLTGFLVLEPLVSFKSGQYHWMTIKKGKKKCIYRNMTNRHLILDEDIHKMTCNDYILEGWKKHQYVSLDGKGHFSNYLIKNIEEFEVLHWILQSDREYTNVKFLGLGANDSFVFYAMRHDEHKKELKVTLKFSKETTKRTKELLEESKILEKLSRTIKNIPKVHDTNIAEINSQKYFYFEMEYIEGYPLDNLIENGDIRKEEFLRIIEKVQDILKKIHAEEYIHGYVQLQNILYNRDTKQEEEKVFLVDLIKVQKRTKQNKNQDFEELKKELRKQLKNPNIKNKDKVHQTLKIACKDLRLN